MPSAGNSIRVPILDSTLSDASGHYILNLPPGFDGSGVIDPGTGLVTYDVIVDSTTPAVHTMTSLQADANGNQPATANRLAKTQPQRTDFAGTAATTTTDPSTSDAQFTEIEPEPAVISYSDTPAVPNADGSEVATVQVVRDYGNRWTVVGSWFSNTDHVQGDFNYSNGADSSLGFGISGSGTKGSFSFGGTESTSSSGGVGFPTDSGHGGWFSRTEFHYKLYKYNQCSKACLPPKYKAEPASFSGGADQVKTGTWRPSGLTQCVSFLANSTWDKHDTHAMTWSNGVSIAGPIGIDLSSRTGYNTNADTKVTFNAKRKLCGRDYPGNTPYALLAKPLK